MPMRALGHRIKAKAKNLGRRKPPGLGSLGSGASEAASRASTPATDERRVGSVAPGRDPEAGQSARGYGVGPRQETTPAPPPGSVDDVETGEIPASVQKRPPPGDARAFEAEGGLDLWREAFDKLSGEEQQQIITSSSAVGRRPSEAAGHERAASSIIPDLIAQTRARQEECERGSWRVRLGRGPADEIILRDQAALVVSWLTKAGDVGVQFAPSVAQQVWPCVKAVLGAPVREAEQMAALLSVAEKVSRAATRGRVYEACFLDPPGLSLSADVLEDLHESLVAVYKACFGLLARAIGLLAKNLFQRMAHSILHPDAVKQEAGSGFSDLERQLSQSVEAASAAVSKDLLGRVQSLDAPITRVDERVSKVLESVEAAEERHILEWTSPVPYFGHHESVAERRMAGTCEWLLRHTKFQEWEASSGCALLWLQGLCENKFPLYTLSYPALAPDTDGIMGAGEHMDEADR